MKRSDEIREEMLKLTKSISNEIGEVPRTTIAVTVAIGIYTMMTEIACQLADMNESER